MHFVVSSKLAELSSKALHTIILGMHMRVCVCVCARCGCAANEQ